ncbi:SDR family oxidoreductase [Pelagibacteraceae bacterium]|nr:SDR family oxidoreductase [Pelagibacteraceae bacterium]
MKKKYLIFGATGSIGSALAKKLYSEKKDCHLIGRNEDEIKKIASKYNYTYSICDVQKLNFMDSLDKDLSEIEILGVAYCVGSIDIKPFRQTQAKDFVSSYILNLVSAADIIRTLQENLKKNRGSVVLFSTVAAKKGFANHAIIASAKAGVEGLTVSLAAELSPNIRINCISPSLTKSKMSNFLVKNEKNVEAITRLHPLKRLGEGHDAAALASFLLSEESSWITGQIIGVDGGRSSVA